MPYIEEIEVELVPDCPFCDTFGQPFYTKLRDHTFGAPGIWHMSCCPSCSLIWLNPRPTGGDIGKVYRTYYTHGENQAGSTFQVHVRKTRASQYLLQLISSSVTRIQDAILAVRFGYTGLHRGSLDTLVAWTFGVLPGMVNGASMQVLGLKSHERGRILDVGCGNGTFLSRMRGLGWDTAGHEMDAVAARYARNHFGLEIKEGLLAEADFAPASFDVITLSHVIEHVHMPHDLVTQCQILLKPGGKLIVLTPNAKGIGHRVFGASWRGLEPPRHLYCFTPQSLTACVERTGMKICQLSTPSRMMRAIWYTSRLIQRAHLGEKMANNAFDYIAAYSMEIVEGALRHVVKNLGEEIMLIAKKTL